MPAAMAAIATTPAAAPHIHGVLAVLPVGSTFKGTCRPSFKSWAR